MAPASSTMRAVAALAVLSVASATITCPAANMQNTTCLCTSGCSINGDAVDFPWSAPAYPVPVTDLGSNTICATVVLPCSTAAAAVNAFLGVTGDIQIDGVSRRACARPRCARCGTCAQLRSVVITSSDCGLDPPCSNDIVGCQANAQVVIHTGFTDTECANFATKYNALVAATPSVVYPTPLLCNTNACNGAVSVISGAGRAAASAAVLAALAVATLL